LFPAPELKEHIEKIANARMEICQGCTYHSEVRKKKLNYKTIRPDVHCVNCGCTLAAKTKCLSCSCPINLWGAAISKEQEDEIQNLMGDENKKGAP
jgi:hypothetical protein